MPVQPPHLPTFEKAKYATGPWGALFSSFFDLLQPFLKATVDTLRQGVPVQAFMDIEILDGQSYPMREMQNPIPGGAPIHGVLVAGVFDPSDPAKTVLASSTAALTIVVTPSAGTATATGTVALPPLAVFVEWSIGVGGGLVVQRVTGLPTGKTSTVRLLVIAK